jgi:hypothetical protein
VKGGEPPVLARRVRNVADDRVEETLPVVDVGGGVGDGFCVL